METETGTLPKVAFAEKTEAPVELKSAVLPKKKKAGRPKKIAPEDEKAKEKMEQAIEEFVLTKPEIKTETQQIEEQIPKLIDVATLEALELAQDRAAALERELYAVSHQLAEQKEQASLAVHTAMIVGGVVGGASAAGVLQLVKFFLGA